MGLIAPNLFKLVSLKNEPWQVSGLNCNIVLVARDKSSEVSGRGITEGEMEAPSLSRWLQRCPIMSLLLDIMKMQVHVTNVCILKFWSPPIVHNNCIRMGGNLQTLKIISLLIIAIYQFFVCSQSFWRICNSLFLSLQKGPPQLCTLCKIYQT